MHTPLAMRPARPARCCIEASEITVVANTARPARCNLVFANPLSMTMRTPGSVIDVSATFVAR